MLFCLVFLLASLFLIILCLPVNFVISYEKSPSVYFRFLFIKKRIPIDIKTEGGFFASLEEISKSKSTVFNLYSKLNGKVKISKLQIKSYVDLNDAFLFPFVYSLVYSLIGFLVGALDLEIGISKKHTDISVNCAILDTPALIFVKIVLKTSLFSFLFASTYTLFKAIFNGGKNGRKQAK